MDAFKLIISILICQFAGVVGSIFTYPAISGWYGSLAKPFFTPPNWAFAPVWLTLFALMGISLYLVWAQQSTKVSANKGLKFFKIQLALNVLWSIVFFGLQSPVLGLVVIVLLWFAILYTILEFWRASRNAAWLLVPYIVWVTIAAALNAGVWLLN